jgi:hypothetical protein
LAAQGYPAIEVGVIEFNRNPENCSAEVERAAFNPANWCPASASRRTRCCRAGCSPTATRNATARVDGNRGGRLGIGPNSDGEWQEQPDFREPPLAINGTADQVVTRACNCGWHEDENWSGIITLSATPRYGSALGNVTAIPGVSRCPGWQAQRECIHRFSGLAGKLNQRGKS